MGVGTHACHSHAMHSCACGMGPQVDTGRFPLDYPPLYVQRQGLLLSFPIQLTQTFCLRYFLLGLQDAATPTWHLSGSWGSNPQYLGSTELGLRQILTL